ncbi:hypothetical protein BYT27DRAFT_7213934 [Phlegmacium glaucopus]|nr:hypothetical protein BYT27DRAFT_7213934 [Phlegmacium glaucopus]
MYSSSSIPRICNCQNQLAHYGWDGIPHEDLPDLCKRTMGTVIGNTPISEKNDKKFTFGNDSANLDTSPTKSDPEWEQVILRQAGRNRPKDLVKAVEIMDEGGVGGLTHTKGCKCMMSDKGDIITWTGKKSKKGTDFRINLHVGKKRSMVKISVKIT